MPQRERNCRSFILLLRANRRLAVDENQRLSSYSHYSARRFCALAGGLGRAVLLGYCGYVPVTDWTHLHAILDT